MYSLNYFILVDHDGMFIFVDPGYPGSYRDVTILKNSFVQRNLRQLFTNQDHYFEFILEDQGYTGMEKYIMHGFNKVERRTLQLPPGLARTFNRMHADYRVRVEWGIRGLKMKWRRLQKRFDLVKPKFSIMFMVDALMTNFLHQWKRDIHEVVEGPKDARPQHRG